MRSMDNFSEKYTYVNISLMTEIIYFIFHNRSTKYWNMGYVILTCQDEPFHSFLLQYECSKPRGLLLYLSIPNKIIKTNCS